MSKNSENALHISPNYGVAPRSGSVPLHPFASRLNLWLCQGVKSFWRSRNLFLQKKVLSRRRHSARSAGLERSDKNAIASAKGLENGLCPFSLRFCDFRINENHKIRICANFPVCEGKQEFSPNDFGGSTPTKSTNSANRELPFDCGGAVKRNALAKKRGLSQICL